MAKLGEQLFKDANIDTLISTMEKMDTATREEVLKAIGQKMTQAGKASAVNKIKNIIRTADPQVKEWIAQAIPNSYIAGLKNSDKELGKKTANITIDDLITLKDLSVHADAVNALMSDSYLDFAN